MPVRCPHCHQTKHLLVIVEGDLPLTPFVLTENDKVFMKNRGIAADDC